MSKRPIVFCAQCKFSAPDKTSSWNIRCHNLEVNRNDGWALGSADDMRGVDCTSERRTTGWFSICGIKGKQYEPKEVTL